MRRLIIVIACSLLAPWVVAFLTWGGLPDPMPMHFDLAGKPDGYVDRTWLNWALLPILSNAVSAVFAAIALSLSWFARVKSKLAINGMPGGESFQRLTPDARVRVVQPMAVCVALCTVPIAAMMAAS